ncbi:MAG: hypothetical protein HFI93_05700 [Lachnospiraceae bacterium]|nr:hypothetical protein [Lachnospiraceae bacterium]
MNKAYNRIEWENYPSDKTPLNEQNLNRVDLAVDEIDNRVLVLDTTKATKEEVAPLIKEIRFEEKTGIFTITRKNGAAFTIDTKLEKIAVNFTYDPVAQQIILTLIDGTKQYIDLSALITEYEFLDTDTVSFFIEEDGKVSAIVKEGSIEEKHLRPDYLAEIKLEAAKAQASQQAADASAKAAKKSEINAKASEDAAKVSEINAKASETNALNSKTAAVNSAAAAKISETNAKTSETNAKASEISASESGAIASASAETATQKATEASVSASDANTYAKQSQSYAVGTGGTRPGEATDNSKYYYEKSKDIYDNFSSSGNVTGVKGDAESTYRSGNVNLTKENIGLGNVDNTADLDKIVKKSLAMATHLIPANADLNDYREVAGRYACFGDSTAVTILNRPSGARSFYMDLFRSNNNETVIGTTGYGYLLQILYNIDGDRIWIRSYYGGSASEVQNKNWTEWRELYPPDRLKEFAVSTTENTIWSCGTNGIGYVKTENIGDPGFNVPAGALFQQRFSSDWIYRIFGNYRTGEMATRGWNNGVAQPWRIQVDSLNIGLFGIKASQGIPENADLNNYITSGFYKCPYNNRALTILNKPIDNHAFALLVMDHTEGSAGATQLFTIYNTARIWVRRGYNGTWGTWVEMVSEAYGTPKSSKALTDGATGALITAQYSGDAVNIANLTRICGWDGYKIAAYSLSDLIKKIYTSADYYGTTPRIGIDAIHSFIGGAYGKIMVSTIEMGAFANDSSKNVEFSVATPTYSTAAANKAYVDNHDFLYTLFTVNGENRAGKGMFNPTTGVFMCEIYVKSSSITSVPANDSISIPVTITITSEKYRNIIKTFAHYSAMISMCKGGISSLIYTFTMSTTDVTTIGAIKGSLVVSNVTSVSTPFNGARFMLNFMPSDMPETGTGVG